MQSFINHREHVDYTYIEKKYKKWQLIVFTEMRSKFNICNDNNFSFTSKPVDYCIDIHFLKLI